MGPRSHLGPMKVEPDPALTQLFGSRTRLLSLAVLANADRPLTGYRVARTAGLSKIKAYEQLRAALAAGWLVRSGPGFVMPEGDLRTFLRRRLRIRWSVDLTAPHRTVRRAVPPAGSYGWYDPAKFPPDPRVRARYEREFFRPYGKGEFPQQDPARRSRKTR